MDPYGKACVDYLNGERDISIQFSSEIAKLLFCSPHNAPKMHD
jgi:hypothetical protein